MKKLTTIGQVAQASHVGNCLRLDTLLKIAPEFWPEWDIDMDPNDPEVRQAGIDGYRVEWEESTQEQTDSVAEGARRSGLGDSNSRMNEAMAGCVLNHLFPLGDLHILDLGCGPGGSTAAFFQAWKQSETVTQVNHQPHSITLVDPAATASQAGKAVGEAGFKITVNAYQSLAEDWLPDADLGETNIVLFGASLHHMNVDLVLANLQQKLPSGALVGVAEWCHCMLKSPAHFRVMVSVLDQVIEPGILSWFDKKFPGARAAQQDVLSKESPEEMAAMLAMAGGFWPNHALACKFKGIEPMFSPYEGHRPKDVWVREFEQHGFKTLKVCPLNPDNPVNTVFLFRKP